MNNHAISCQSISKCYRLYAKPRDRLIESISHAMGRWLPIPTTNLGRDYWALRTMSFSIMPGETVAIIGQNGSGKSTLLQIITGILTPTEGVVSVNGRVAALLELGAGFNQEFSGMENLWMTARILGLCSDEIEHRLHDILAFADIGEHIHQPVKTYSSGMYVRLAFAISIHVNPDILIVDEALAVGDMLFQSKCMARIRRLQEEGKTLLFVSHDVAAVRALCARSIYLSHGELLDIGDTASVVDHYIRDMQNEQSKRHVHSAPKQRIQAKKRSFEGMSDDLARRFTEFDEQQPDRQHGTGEARIRCVELLDEKGCNLEWAEFDEQVTVRIWIECIQPCAVSVNYKIRDRHLVSVAGADFLITNQGLLTMLAGHYYLVTYVTQLPLMDGHYSLRISITIPIANHDDAVFLDVVEVTNAFKLMHSPRGKIYTHVYLPNTISVKTYPSETV